MSAARIGILLYDHIDADIAAVHGDYEQRYRRLLGPLGDRAVLHDAAVDPPPEAVDSCDAWLLGGSRRDAFDDDDHTLALVEFVSGAVAARIPLVGICYGHQLVARALGATVQRAPGWAVGVKHYDVVGDARWMSGSPSSVAFVASHRDQVSALPPGADLVATSSYCEIAGFRLENRVFCLQAHPEFDQSLSAALVERRATALGEPVVSDAMASLEDPIDDDVASGWIVGFLTGE